MYRHYVCPNLAKQLVNTGYIFRTEKDHENELMGIMPSQASFRVLQMVISSSLLETSILKLQ